MRLTEEGLKDRKAWEEAGYQVPKYDRQEMKRKTKEMPQWVHFGAGNLFRAFHARIAQTMLEKGKMETGLVVVEGFDGEIVERMYRPHDNLSILVTLKGDGRVEKEVIGSIAESDILDQSCPEEVGRLKEVFGKESLKLATFTITEKGYRLIDGEGNLSAQVKEDFERGPSQAESYMGKVASLLYVRYQKGKLPIAMVSTDNCSHNGDKLKEAMVVFAREWEKRGKVEKGYGEYVNDPDLVSFPWTMIDKITPRPDGSVEGMLVEDGVEQPEGMITEKGTYIAPFVNGEESEYLVVEDQFPNGRPALEEGGVLFTNRKTVEKVERMKVCTCLNPLHTALALFGCLLGYEKIADELKDPQLKKLILQIGYQEGLPVAEDPGILSPREFLDQVVKVRLPNPFLPDTPQRIATDTSQKLSIRFGETIKAYERQKGRKAEELTGIPLVYAGWLRYLMGVDDKGEPFSLSPDPLLENLKPYIKELQLGGKIKEPELFEKLKKLLSDEKIFGVNLYETGLAKKVCSYLAGMLEGPGAVRKVLEMI